MAISFCCDRDPHQFEGQWALKSAGHWPASTATLDTKGSDCLCKLIGSLHLQGPGSLSERSDRGQAHSFAVEICLICWYFPPARKNIYDDTTPQRASLGGQHILAGADY